MLIHARNFIDHLRRSLIGPLMVALSYPFLLAGLATSAFSTTEVSALLSFGFIAFMGATALTGAIVSLRTQRPNRGQSPLLQLQHDPDHNRPTLVDLLNQPLEGCAPPPAMKRLVHLLGRPGPGWAKTCELTLSFAALSVWGLVMLSPARRVFAVLPADDQHRLTIALVSCGVLGLVTLRGWATSQYLRLNLSAIA